jgi:UDP-GlcNAc:undecaprenyl-phosphate GlcNAc-1-phosphate transferase
LPTHTAIEVLRHVWWIGVVSLLISLAFTPVVRHIAYRFRIVDLPDYTGLALKPHARPVAYLGGVAMCIGVLAGLACYLVVMPDLSDHMSAIRSSISSRRLMELRTNPVWNIFGIAGASIVITVVGLADDLRKLPPRQKVYGQVLAAVVLLCGGVGVRMTGVFFGLMGLDPPTWIVVLTSVPIVLLVTIAACNATNLLDGLDGLCGGVTAIIAIGFLALAVHLAIYARAPGTDSLRVGLCLAMAGAVLGFLPYNIPPASIFMGDAGSTLLGFFVATMMALFCREGNARWLVAACAVFALPIFDTALAVVRRLLLGRSIFAGDRSHLYDQLVDRGMSVKQVVVLFYALAAVSAVIGVLTAIYLRGRYAVVMYAVLFTVIWLIFGKLGMIRPGTRSQGGS